VLGHRHAPLLLHRRSHAPLVVKHLFTPLHCLLSDQGHREAATTSESKPPLLKPPLLSEPLLRTPWIQFVVCLTSSSLPRCCRTVPRRCRPPGAATTTGTSPPIPDSAASPLTGYSGELPPPSPCQAGSPSPPRARAGRPLHLVHRRARASCATAATPCAVTTDGWACYHSHGPIRPPSQARQARPRAEIGPQLFMHFEFSKFLFSDLNYRKIV
jgi:hypothetical protein